MGDKIAILKQGGVLAQYDRPEEILENPNSDFVASFVGTDRVLKHLSLVRVGELELEPYDGNSDGLPRISEGSTLKDALSVLIGSGTDRGLVYAGDGSNGDGHRGAITLDGIRSVSRSGQGG